MSRTLRLSIIATMLLATTALGTIAYKAFNPPLPPAPEPTPAPVLEPKPRPRILRILPIPHSEPKPDPQIACAGEAKYAFNKSDLTSEELLEYIDRHPDCLKTPVALLMGDTSIADRKRREANLRQQIKDCETLSRMETLTPPGRSNTLIGLGTNAPTIVQAVSRADACWKYAEILRKELGIEQPPSLAEK